MPYGGARRRNITLPNNFDPRPYQKTVWEEMDAGKRFAFLVWHRRAGKDVSWLHYTAKTLHKRIGTYYHMLPTQRQARRVIWNAIDGRTGVRLLDWAFPKELRKRTLEDEMLIEFKCGSIWQLVGSDNYDAIVGTNVVGMVFSEWSISNPRVFDYMSPILAENDGWAAFIGTPRGKNWFYDQYQTVKNNPNWFVDIKTVDDTKAIPLDRIQMDRERGMSEDRIQQEYWCSFDARVAGLIYDSYITALEKRGKIAPIEYDPRYPVETSWDLGHKDATAIWFSQQVGNEVRFIDYVEERGKDLAHFINVVHAKPYRYSRHIGPHDTNKFEFGAGSTITETARQHGLMFTIAPKLNTEDGIEATRLLLPRCAFNSQNPEVLRGLRALRHYHYDSDAEEQDDDTKITLATKPKHDWSSHCCDAIRYRAVTPDGQGVLPDWARQYVPQAQVQHRMGHNGGPPMVDEYDPLSAF